MVCNSKLLYYNMKRLYDARWKCLTTAFNKDIILLLPIKCFLGGNNEEYISKNLGNNTASIGTSRGIFNGVVCLRKGFTEKRRQYMVLYAGRRKGQLIYGACQILWHLVLRKGRRSRLELYRSYQVLRHVVLRRKRHT